MAILINKKKEKTKNQVFYKQAQYKQEELFRQGVELGQRLIWLHTYGARFVPSDERVGTVSAGRARAIHPVPVTAEGLP